MIYRINEEYFQVELYRETTDTEPCEVIELDDAIHAYHDWQKIVRCKECKHRKKRQIEYLMDIEGKKYCGILCAWVKDDDFCSYGERSD